MIFTVLVLFTLTLKKKNPVKVYFLVLESWTDLALLACQLKGWRWQIITELCFKSLQTNNTFAAAVCITYMLEIRGWEEGSTADEIRQAHLQRWCYLTKQLQKRGVKVKPHMLYITLVQLHMPCIPQRSILVNDLHFTWLCLSIKQRKYIIW